MSLKKFLLELAIAAWGIGCVVVVLKIIYEVGLLALGVFK